jgi:hypothetical protein
MTNLLQQVITELEKLPVGDQDAIATLILEEIADEKRWQNSFAASQDQLANLAKKVREDIRQGKVRPIGIDEL